MDADPDCELLDCLQSSSEYTSLVLAKLSVGVVILIAGDFLVQVSGGFLQLIKVETVGLFKLETCIRGAVVCRCVKLNGADFLLCNIMYSKPKF